MIGQSPTGRIVAYMVLSLAAGIALFPVALMLLNACKASVEIVMNPLGWPSTPRYQNFVHAWQDARLGHTLLNSTLVSGLTILFTCSTGSMAAYAITGGRMKHWRLFNGYFLASTTLPIQLFLLPLYFIFAHLRLIDNVPAVSVIYTAIYSPFAILLLRTYFMAVPRELEDAARMDGATSWQIFTRVMLPIISPGLLTVSLIVGLYTWNEFLIATTFLQDRNAQTAIVSFYTLGGQYSSDWGEIMAAAVIIVLPVVLFFLFLQRSFIEGMAGGSVKG
ncbi:MAG: carbohydrate ABC transporter permease [Janthinobacterium lividum]